VFDLLVADVIMPGMSGRQVIAHVTAARPNVPVLFDSGYTEDQVLRHDVWSSGAAFLHQPLSTAQLTTRVRELLDSHKFR